MGHHHHHHRRESSLKWSILLNVIITGAQVVGGILSGSLALLSDALHNFSDVISLIVSYIALLLGKSDASKEKTFGYKRAEIIAAFVNASTLIIVGVLLIVEATQRFISPQAIDGNLVIWFAVLGIAVNGFSVLLIKRDAHVNMNMKSAYLHLLTDMLASIAVLIGGLLMHYFNWFWIDALLTLSIALYLIVISYSLLVDSTKILMLFTPKNIDLVALEQDIKTIELVNNVHHVHVWQLNEEEIHLEAHIDFDKDISLMDFGKKLKEVEQMLFEKYHINHITLQPEHGYQGEKPLIVQD
jgi:cobalt-zinc-cadmium efflux system protein